MNRFQSLACVAVLAALAAPTAVADDFFWTGADGFNYNTLENWSTQRSTDGPVIFPVEPPGADDHVIWAYDNNYQRSLFLGGEFSDAGAFTVQNRNNVFPFINNGVDNAVRESWVLHGLAIDHTEAAVNPFSGDLDITVLREAVPNTVLNINQSTTIASGFESATPGNPPTGLDILFAGGGLKAVNVQGSIQLRVEGTVGEFDGVSAGLEKWGFATMRINGGYALTDDLVLRQGSIQIDNGFETPGGLVLTSTEADGEFKRFALFDDQDYKFSSVTINAGAENELVLDDGTYTIDDLANLGVGDFFPSLMLAGALGQSNPGLGTGTLTVGAIDVPLLFGDYNDDGVVNSADYTVWRDNLDLPVTLPNDPTPGQVTAEDYTVWANAFGATSGASATAVPEPAGMLLLAIGVIGFGIRSRR